MDADHILKHVFVKKNYFSAGFGGYVDHILQLSKKDADHILKFAQGQVFEKGFLLQKEAFSKTLQIISLNIGRS